jgi:hypothetical protein
MGGDGFAADQHVHLRRGATACHIGIGDQGW